MKVSESISFFLSYFLYYCCCCCCCYFFYSHWSVADKRIFHSVKIIIDWYIRIIGSIKWTSSFLYDNWFCCSVYFMLLTLFSSIVLSSTLKIVGRKVFYTYMYNVYCIQMMLLLFILFTLSNAKFFLHY